MAEDRDPIDLGVVFTDRTKTMRKYLRVGMYEHVEGEIKEDYLMVNIRVWNKFPNSDTVYPTSNGIALLADEFNVLMVNLIILIYKFKLN